VFPFMKKALANSGKLSVTKAPTLVSEVAVLVW
jgi:hypothetical protein